MFEIAEQRFTTDNPIRSEQLTQIFSLGQPIAQGVAQVQEMASKGVSYVDMVYNDLWTW